MGVPVTSEITPYGGGAFATHDEQFGKGGFRSVADVTARNALPAGRRAAGMWVKTLSDGLLFSLGADLTTWTQVAFGGFARAPVTVVAPGNLVLSGLGQTIDGIAINDPLQSVLAPFQTTAADRRIYNPAAGAWTPRLDFATSADAVAGCFGKVLLGTIYGGGTWTFKTLPPIVMGTTALDFDAATYIETTTAENGYLFGVVAGVAAMRPPDVLVPAGNGVEWSGNALRLQASIPARGTEMVSVDALPSVTGRGTLATSGGTGVIDFPLDASRHATITAMATVKDAAGNIVYAKGLTKKAYRKSSGNCLSISEVILDNEFVAMAVTFASSINGTNIRFTLTNSTATAYTYQILAGAFTADLP